MSGSKDFKIALRADESSLTPAFDKAGKILRKFEEGPVRRMNTNLDDATRRSRLDQFEKSWARIGSEVRGVGDQLFNMLPGLGVLGGIGTGAGIATAATAMVSSFAQQGRTLQQWSALLGISVERLQTLIGAAAQRGIDQDALLNALASLQQSLDKARLGDPTLLNVLTQLRLRLPERDQALDLPKRLEEIADAIARQDLAERKVEVAGHLGVMPLFQLLREGAPGLRQLEESVPRIGRFSESSAAKANELAISIDRLGIAAQGAAFKIGEALGGKTLADYMTGFFELLGATSQEEFLSLLGQDVESLRKRSRTGAAGPSPLPPGMPSLFDKKSDEFTAEELRKIGRQSAVSGTDGRVIINLRVESEPGLKTRAVVQDEGQVQTEVFMPTDGP